LIELSIPDLAMSFEDDEVVFLAGSSGEATELSAALSNPDVRIAAAHFVTSFVPGINMTCLARPDSRSRQSVFFMQRSMDGARLEGRIDFRPTSYFGIHRYLSGSECRLDAVVAQISPPDRRGFCSLGPAVEFMPTVLARASRKVGIINPNVPNLPGSFSLPLDGFQAIAHSSAPLAAYHLIPALDKAGALVANLAQLIPHGATLQIGLGKIPSQLLDALKGHQDLCLHTGMISDAALRLASTGALRTRKAILTGVAVGSGEFYSRLSAMNGLEFADVGITHEPSTLLSLSKFHAVNSALEVDLLGQVNAETVRGRYVGGPGGLPDFARAAHLDPEGLSIIALNATEAGGAISKIVSQFEPGTPVTVPQHDVDAVVTEYGVALLRGQSLDERARRLCAIASPTHRTALEQAARTLLR